MYSLGSTGSKVVLIQKALKDLGYYQGNTDGIFGAVSAAAVKKFQLESNLTVTGKVDDDTWTKLFPSVPVILSDLTRSCLALTGSFETSTLSPECFASVTGNFDGQGMSFGALQWNFGQGSLQPLLKDMVDNHQDVLLAIFKDKTPILKNIIGGSISSGVAFAKSIQVNCNLISPWKDMFHTLGLTKEFQDAEIRSAGVYYKNADHLAADFYISSKRGHALMFDICVQNGSIRDDIKTLMLNDIKLIDQSLSPDMIEIAKMRIIANMKADSANPKFREDVRTRKLCIANGVGVVHGVKYDLAKQFGLDLNRAD